MPKKKTFTHLQGRKRPPSDYEELSTGLMWRTPPHVNTRHGTWREKDTALRADWEEFRDPTGLTYRTYVARQDAAERQLDGVLRTGALLGVPDGLDGAWRRALATLVGAMSFAEWGVGMLHQQVERFSLSSTLAQSAQLQVMDKMRHAQRDLEVYDLVFGEPEGDDDPVRQLWMEGPDIQPLRRYIEEALGRTDWAELIVAANLGLGGLVTPFLREMYLEGGRRYRDSVVVGLGTAFGEDEARAVAWTDAFVKLTATEPANSGVISGWLEHYLPPATEVVSTLAGHHPLDGIADKAAATAAEELATRLSGLDLDVGPAASAALAEARGVVAA
ncbi:MAG: hypothetical protein ACRDY7_04415 [Acidimicrobiia bacterium]